MVKPANESGGYGMLVGPHSTKKQRTEFARLIKKNPRNYIAQPTLSLSVAPTLCDEGLAPRHLDLRPFVAAGRENLRYGWRAYAGGDAKRLPGGEFVPGRWKQGYLDRGRGELMCCHV